MWEPLNLVVKIFSLPNRKLYKRNEVNRAEIYYKWKASTSTFYWVQQLSDKIISINVVIVLKIWWEINTVTQYYLRNCLTSPIDNQTIKIKNDAWEDEYCWQSWCRTHSSTHKQLSRPSSVLTEHMYPDLSTSSECSGIALFGTWLTISAR